MKKIFCVALMLSATTAGIFGQSGIIRELTGDVSLKPAGAADFIPAKKSDEVARDTIVSTGFKSSAIIEVGSSIISVRPITRLSLAEIQSASGAENLNIDLHTGRVRVDVKPPTGTRANVSVQSPIATASVRGTSFEFDTVNLTVSEGKVVFGGSSGAVTMVNPGESSYITTEGTAASPVEIKTTALLPPTPAGTDATAFAETPPASAGELIISPTYR